MDKTMEGLQKKQRQRRISRTTANRPLRSDFFLNMRIKKSQIKKA